MRVPTKTAPEFATPPRAEVEVDVWALRKELEGRVEGEVRFGAGDRAIYSTGGSNYRQLPIGVVIPRTADDAVATVAVCRDFGAPVLPRGGGTSLAGQCCNVAVVLDFSKYMHRVLEIDPDRAVARVEPGAILDHLREAAEAHGLTYGPDPSTHDHCTLGGMIGNDSCGWHSVLSEFYGPGPLTAHHVVELDVLTYRGDRMRVGSVDGEELARITAAGGARGELYERLADLGARYESAIRERYPDLPRRVSGYNLDRLLPSGPLDVAAALTGTEGTCATVLEATVRLTPSPPVRAFLVVGFEDAAAAGDAVPLVREHRPVGLEGIDDVLVQDMTAVGLHSEDASLLPDGRGWLLVEFGGETKDDADGRAHDLMDALKNADGVRPTATRLYDDPEREQHITEVREAGLGATAFIPGKPDAYEGWEDSAVPPEHVGDYIRDLRKLGAKYGYESALYGHYGQGCIHARWNFDLQNREGIRTFRAFLDEAADLVLSYGGSLSGEHGDGQSRAELLPKMFGPELVGAFREFKSIWDPDWKMNPGKVVDPYPITENLRLGEDYAPPVVRTHFAYPEDGGSFTHATVRCVGIGKCRRTGGGVMCPSFMATREEKHTTRGRARILFEMLRGSELDLWRSDEVFDALDLCLACKGCTNDCPVGVDLPTLKSEFLSHYYEHRLRPRHAYAFGLIDEASRLASRAPGVVNAIGHAPGLSRLVKLAAGMAPARELPVFAPRTLRHWFFSRPERNGGGRRAVLWPDTFNNFFHVEVGVAAVETLEDAGYHVVMPRGHLCCGRPLYDYGFLGLARRYLERILDELREDIRAGTPVVGLEPSCVAVFKDELTKLMPGDEDAKRLAKATHHFAELLAGDGYQPPTLAGRRVLAWGHCHHKATGGMDPEHELLQAMGVELQPVEGGCCGLAGSFGFETEHYDLSMACGEQALLPAVRGASAETFVVADGFSCKTQIEHATGRRALHVAELLRLAQRGSPSEKPAPSTGQRVGRGAAAAVSGLVVAAGGLALARAVR
jgi:FAD/FMN-containing dehydrogenase/Fe-S oxidoreductase